MQRTQCLEHICQAAKRLHSVWVARPQHTLPDDQGSAVQRLGSSVVAWQRMGSAPSSAGTSRCSTRVQHNIT